MWKSLALLLVLLCCLKQAGAQSAEPLEGAEPAAEHGRKDPAPEMKEDTVEHRVRFVVGDIVVSGNRRTKKHIILRELPFQEGDSVILPELVQQFEIARQQLMNTRLFNEAVVALRSFRGYTVDINIDVKERWYIFPIPYLRPVDRNLAEWSKQGFSANRLNYGIKFAHYNFSGRNDKMRLWLITGYSKQFQFQYDQPYADESLRHGYRVYFNYSAYNEINYGTINNQQAFTDSFPGTRTISGSLEYHYRPGLRTFHHFRVGYTDFRADSQVLALNPHYFKNGITRVKIPEFAYTLRHIQVDYVPFPLKGWMAELSFAKRGLESHTNLWQLSMKYNLARELGSEWYFNWQANGVLRLPFDQPFYHTQMFGYNDFYLRGLEKYVVDGVAGFLSKHTIRRHLLSFHVPTYLRSTTHDRVPFRIYAKAYADMGHALNRSSPQNSLANRMLYSGGFGIDVVSFYDLVFRIDYSFNQLGQNGLFLHFRNEF